MYIKFCRSYGEDKKDDVKKNLSSVLSVELEDEKDKQQDNTEGNGQLYRFGCLILTLICLVLLLVVIILCVKLQAGSSACPEKLETATDTQSRQVSPTCSCEQCQTHYTNIQAKHLGCQQCANGWLTYGRSCFFLSTFRLSWDESQRNCTARGGTLAVITSQRVQNFLTKEGKLNYWIGLRHNGQKWTWVNGTELQQRYWAEEKSSGDCGILSSSSPQEKNWIQASCQAYTYFICHVQF